jgi:hypothetical protein
MKNWILYKTGVALILVSRLILAQSLIPNSGFGSSFNFELVPILVFFSKVWQFGYPITTPRIKTKTGQNWNWTTLVLTSKQIQWRRKNNLIKEK